MPLTIDRLGHQGDGIAATSEGAVFVPRTLPGEVVEGEIVDGRIAAPRILTPSPDRVAAPCRHYKSCGGCALQHASDAFVAEWKIGVVRTALAAQGLEANWAGIETSAPGSRRRATFSGRRTKKGALIGFHAPKSDVVTEIPGCHLLHPDLLATRPACEALILAGGSRKGEMKLAATLSEDGVDMSVTGGKPLDRELEVELAAIAGAHRLARLTWDREVIVQAYPPRQVFAGAPVVPPPGAFLQATADGEAALRRGVEAAVAGASRIVDLFAGCGTFSLPLAKGADVHAVEGEEGMLAALDKGWRHSTGLHKVTTEARDLFRQPLLPDELDRYDAIVIDPPRAGAEAQVREIADSAVKRIGFVSCNPVTFARDAAILVEAGFAIDRLTVVDQFRWSTHVELVANLSR